MNVFQTWLRKSAYFQADRSERTAAESGWDAAVEACVSEVEAAGCTCFILEDGDADFRGRISEHDFGPEDGVEREVERHDPRCPIALADKLRELAR